MAAIGESDARTLAELRARIDDIDEQIHRLLIDRGAVIEALIAAKGTQHRAAFRPQREAEMMRRLAARHTGVLPLPTVEHLWREIITTFTFMQAPFRVVVDYGRDRIAIHDLARFVFGHSVEFVTAAGPADVVARVAASGADLGLVPVGAVEGGPWWRKLSAETGPRIMAVLPFIDTEGRTASAPAFVISPPLAEATAPDLRVYAGTASQEGEASLRSGQNVAVLDAASGADGRRELMVALASGDDEATLHLLGVENVTPIGGVARGIAGSEPGDVLRAPLRAGAPA